MPNSTSKMSRRLGVGVAGLLTLTGVPFAVAHADEAFEFRRIAGDSRFETAALVRDEFGPSSRLILANGERGVFADALVASYLAGATESPILLTRADRLPAATKAAIAASGAQRITIVGGESVVSGGQEAALVAAGYAVDRLAGGNRYGTNAAILDAVGSATSSTAIVTTGVDFPDALAASAVSFQTGMPMAITGKRGTNQGVIDALRDAGVQDFLVLGGEGAVPPAAVADLEDAGLSMVRRFAGADRAETSALFANYAVGELGFTDQAVNVASGYLRGTGADALAGGPLTGKQNRPLLITASKGSPGTTVLGYLRDHAETLTEGIIFGGAGAVEADAMARMTTAARTGVVPPPPPPPGGGGDGGGSGGGEQPPPPPPPPPPPGDGEPAEITLTSTTDRDQRIDLAQSHDVTATVLDSTGQPVPGVPVTFTVSVDQAATGGTASVPAAKDVVTDSAGIASYSYSLPTEAGGHGCFPRPPADTVCISERIDTIKAATANGVNASTQKSWWGNGVENRQSGRIDESVGAAEGRAQSGETLDVFGTAGVAGFVLDGTSRAGEVRNLVIDGSESDPVLGTIRLGRNADPQHPTTPTFNSRRVEGVTIQNFVVHIDEHVTGFDSGFLIVDATGFTLINNKVDAGATYSDEDGIRTAVEPTIASDVPGQFGAGQGTITGSNTFTGLFRGVHIDDGADFTISGNNFVDNVNHVSDYTGKDVPTMQGIIDTNNFPGGTPVVTPEADAEGGRHIVDEDTGTDPDPDPGGAPGLNLGPARADLRSGETHTVTATLADDTGAPVVGTDVTFTVSPTGPTQTVATNATGTATFEYTVPDGTPNRTDTITATAGDATDTAVANWFDDGVQNMTTKRIFPGVQGAENRAGTGDVLEVFGSAAVNGFFVDSGENVDAQGNCHAPVTGVVVDGTAADQVTKPIRIGHPTAMCNGQVMNTSIGVTIRGFDVVVDPDEAAFEVVNARGFHLVGNTVTGSGGGLGVENEAVSAGASAEGQISDGNIFQGLETGILFNAAGAVTASFTVSGNTFSGNTHHATDPTGRSTLDAMLPTNTFQPNGGVVEEESGTGPWHIVSAPPPA